MTRRLYRWDTDASQLVEISADWTPPPRVEIMTGTFYEGTRATDGTAIDTRWKYNEYMRQNGVTHASDFTHTWEKAQSRRERIARGEALPDRDRKEAIGRALYEVMEKKR